MSQLSPTIEGFRAAFRQPSVTLAEIAWRWTVGGVACAALLFAIIEYLDSLPLTKGDAAFLRSKRPLLVERALAHVLHGSLNRAALAAVLAALMLSILWVLAASLGRLATVRVLLNYFHDNFVSPNSFEAVHQFLPLRSLIVLSFFRVAVALASGLAVVALAIIARFASPDSNPNPALSFLIFVLLAGLICVVWTELNWFLSMAGIFALRDGEDALGAISAAATMLRTRSGSVLAVSTWNATAHLAAFVAASSVGFGLLLFVRLVSTQLIGTGEILVALAYFAMADWLYIARLGGYIFVGLAPSAARLTSPGLPPFPPDGYGTQLKSPPSDAVDRDEPILSDLPGLISEF
jgi:hypothetical protein